MDLIGIEPMTSSMAFGFTSVEQGALACTRAGGLNFERLEFAIGIANETVKEQGYVLILPDDDAQVVYGIRESTLVKIFAMTCPRCINARNVAVGGTQETVGNNVHVGVFTNDHSQVVVREGHGSAIRRAKRRRMGAASGASNARSLDL